MEEAGELRFDPLEVLDPAVRTDLVRAAVNNDGAEIATWRYRDLHGLGAGAHIYRVEGEASVGSALVPWSGVVKVFRHGGQGIQAAGERPDAWDYWKRRVVCSTSWFVGLSGGVVPAHCLGVGERPGVAAWVAMEDLSGLDQRPWKLGQFQLVARHLGQFNGAYLAGRRLPADSWLSIDWLQDWTARMEPLDLLTAARDHPLVQQISLASHEKCTGQSGSRPEVAA